MRGKATLVEDDRLVAAYPQLVWRFSRGMRDKSANRTG